MKYLLITCLSLSILLASCDKKASDQTQISVGNANAEVEYANDDSDDNTNSDDNNTGSISGARVNASITSQSLYFMCGVEDYANSFQLKGWYFGTTRPANDGDETERAALAVKNVKTLDFSKGLSTVKSKSLKTGYWVIGESSLGDNQQYTLINVQAGQKSFLSVLTTDENRFIQNSGKVTVSLSRKIDANATYYGLLNGNQIAMCSATKKKDLSVQRVGDYTLTLVKDTGSGTPAQVGSVAISVIGGASVTAKFKLK